MLTINWNPRKLRKTLEANIVKGETKGDASVFEWPPSDKDDKDRYPAAAAA
jgi:hypothetical protein